MFRNALLTSVVSLLLMCVSSMVVLAQDGSTDVSVSGSQLSMTTFTVADVIRNDPRITQSLRQIGLSGAQIEEVRRNGMAQSTSVSGSAHARSDSTRWFFRPCNTGRRSWIIFQIGPGGIGALTTYQRFSDDSTIIVDKESNACPVDAVCGFIASAQSPGLAPSYWGIRYNGPVTRFLSWCL